MVDLIDQYQEIHTEVDAAVLQVIRSAAYINGPQVKAFASELADYLQVGHVLPCANGTDALTVAMMALGLKPGDEVITASFTYVATAEAIALLGLSPVLVDVDPITYCLHPEQVRQAIGPNTKAIVPVHLFGQCAPMQAIMDLAAEHQLFVIEDAAQAIGAEYRFVAGQVKKAGTIGHIGCTSFFPSKNLGCYGDGGALFTHDPALAQRIGMMVNHGQSIQYHHDEIGMNSRLDSIQAAILRVKLPHLDDYNRRRSAVAQAYNNAFSSIEGLVVPHTAPYSSHVFHQYTMQVTRGHRDELRKFLADREIPSMIYYPIPLHLQKAYAHPRYPQGAFPISEHLAQCVLSLPMSPNLSPAQQEIIIETVGQYFKSL
jgi:dTDP-4-amino-4,6-dideoxygalactose transaminase